jgi:hypothetical protein
MGLVMKALQLRPSCLNPIPTIAPLRAKRISSRRREEAEKSGGFDSKVRLVTSAATAACVASTRTDRSEVLRSASSLHLLLVLRSEEQRRGAFWETAGFLAIWLSGLIGVAMCVL